MSPEHRVELQPAFVLHARAYRNTSLLLEIFTRDHGRVGLVARGARGPRSRLRGLLQPFFPLLISWQGRGELMTLTHAEANGNYLELSGRAALNGFYLNELLMRLLPRRDSASGLFEAYGRTLPRLASDEQPALRRFERDLLQELGYQLVLDHDAVSGEPVQPEAEYSYYLESGPTLKGAAAEGALTITGRSLLALASGELGDETAQREVKRLTRMALAPLLGDRPLRSRELFRALARRKLPEGAQ